MPTELASHLRDVLIAGRNPDGGWGYYAGKASRLEPTCWALLSLLDDRFPEDAGVVEAGLHLLAKWQRADGVIAEPQLPPNLAFNGLASLLLTSIRSSGSSAAAPAAVGARLLEGILAIEARTPGTLEMLLRPANPQDDSLVGWPWTQGSFGWVEPVAWCLLAVKKGREGRDERTAWRIGQAENLLFNRQCVSGGWNAGNAQALGQDLNAYVPTTAIALLALQDRRDSASVKRAQRYLLESWRREPAGLALGLTLLAFRVGGLPASEVEAALAEAAIRTGFVGNLAVVGLAHYALTTGVHGPHAFAL
jgi:hypothetical protein